MADLDLAGLNEPSIDFLLLADRAEVVGGKLYLMGGAWERQLVPDFAKPVPLSFAVGVLVPWHATNRQHRLQIRVEDADGKATGLQVEVTFSAGRPAHAQPGDVQRLVIALPAAAAPFPRPGKYVVRAAVNGAEQKQVEFHLLAGNRPQP